MDLGSFGVDRHPYGIEAMMGPTLRTSRRIPTATSVPGLPKASRGGHNWCRHLARKEFLPWNN